MTVVDGDWCWKIGTFSVKESSCTGSAGTYFCPAIYNMYRQISRLLTFDSATIACSEYLTMLLAREFPLSYGDPMALYAATHPSCTMVVPDTLANIF